MGDEDVLIALVLKSGFMATVVETLFTNHNLAYERFEKLEADFERFDVLVIEAGLVEQNIMARSNEDQIVVVIGTAPEGFEADLHLRHPVKWEDFAPIFEQDEAIFDEKTRTEIIELIGKERHQENLAELVKEMEELIAEFSKIPFEEQISSVHRCSGSAAMLGVKRLHQRLLNIETNGRAGNADAFSNAWDGLLGEWPELRAKIETVPGRQN